LLNDTELRLAAWRNGSTQAERLAASVLRLSGFEEIDPQAPLGGPDGTKDIVCSKGGLTWVGAVYFPVAPVRFPAIKKKFNADLAGVTGTRRGMAFVTNQTVTPTQRELLIGLGRAAGKEVEILHLERLRALLDSPLGYGTRLQFLGIPMTPEEQLSWFADSGNQLSSTLTSNTRELMGLKAMIQRMSLGQDHIIRTLGVEFDAGTVTPDLLSVTSFIRGSAPVVTDKLDVALVLLVHRLTCFDLPQRGVGQFRASDVWLGSADGTRAQHVTPPAVPEVPGLLEALCSGWRTEFERLKGASIEERLAGVAGFHARLLVIHPFFDGNGRTARAILMQQCLDLFGRADMSVMEKGARYYAALARADGGDFGDLAAIIRPIIQR
jgi:fido (protein-threonine AMPylation protein)